MRVGIEGELGIKAEKIIFYPDLFFIVPSLFFFFPRCHFADTINWENCRKRIQVLLVLSQHLSQQTIVFFCTKASVKDTREISYIKIKRNLKRNSMFMIDLTFFFFFLPECYFSFTGNRKFFEGKMMRRLQRVHSIFILLLFVNSKHIWKLTVPTTHKSSNSSSRDIFQLYTFIIDIIYCFKRKMSSSRGHAASSVFVGPS